MRYVAFLRGINVGGHKIIKMQDLCSIFESLGFTNIKTYIQSGNVLFDSSEKDTGALSSKIESGLGKKLGYKVNVLLQTMDKIQNIVRSNLFRKIKLNGDTKAYLTFLSSKPSGLKFPIESKNKDVEVINIKDNAAFCLAHKVNGKFGFPNLFIEKQFKMPATTRNLTTVEKIASMG